MNDWHQTLWEAVDRRADELIAVRRHLHAHPEPSGEEFATTQYLRDRLIESGITATVPTHGRGLVVDSRDQSAKRRIALRGDIDALLLADQKQVEYRSRTAGVMHACGHDAHATCAYGAMVALHDLAIAGKLPGPVTWRGLLQPAEETATGAAEMIAAGALEGVDSIFSLHVDPSRPVGTVGVRPRTFTAHCDAFRVEVEGVASHAARPHLAKDPIAAAAQFVNLLYQQVPRGLDSQDAAVIAITQIHGGSTSNVIPDRVSMAGMIRALGSDVRNHVVGHVAQLAESIGLITGTKIQVDFGVHIPGVENDPRLTDLMANVAGCLLGTDRVQWIERPSMGGEDFAFFLEQVPGVMFRLGSARDNILASGLHTPLFDIDERCLAIGAKLLATTVVEASLDS
jgi:amidohydrolase